MDVQTTEYKLELSSTLDWSDDEELTSNVIFVVDSDGAFSVHEETFSSKTNQTTCSVPIELDGASVVKIRDFLSYVLSQTSGVNAQD